MALCHETLYNHELSSVSSIPAGFKPVTSWSEVGSANHGHPNASYNGKTGEFITNLLKVTNPKFRYDHLREI